MITLIGPGGAGKSTMGALIAERLGVAFVDLDRCFEHRAGDVGDYVNRFGYRAYAHENVETYRLLLCERTERRVTALSSGFMTYPQDAHPDYARLRQDALQSAATFVLLPSLNCELCVAETVRRQLARPFARTAEREEAVIRDRFPIHVGLAARKIETMHPIGIVVDEILLWIRHVNPDA